MELSLLIVRSLFVKEQRRNPGAVLHEVVHSDVHVDSRLALGKTVGFDRQPFAERGRQATLDYVDENRVDDQRAVADIYGWQAVGHVDCNSA